MEACKIVGIGIERAKKTVLTTTQNAARDVTIPLTKVFRTRQEIFWRQRFFGMTNTDTIIAGVRSALGNNLAHIYVMDSVYVRIYPFGT